MADYPERLPDIDLTAEQLRQLQNPTGPTTPFVACLCGKLMARGKNQRRMYSGTPGAELPNGINYTELLCGDCRQDYKDLARIVCLGCRSLMGFYKPGKQKTGFVFERGRHYHILDCPRCNNAVTATPVLEHEHFMRANGIASKSDSELVKEIEQKRLRGASEAVRMRAEIQPLFVSNDDQTT